MLLVCCDHYRDATAKYKSDELGDKGEYEDDFHRYSTCSLYPVAAIRSM